MTGKTEIRWTHYYDLLRDSILCSHTYPGRGDLYGHPGWDLVETTWKDGRFSRSFQIDDSPPWWIVTVPDAQD